jgi:hypothetical protein
MGAHYSGPSLDEKKADKDYDGDGKVESSVRKSTLVLRIKPLRKQWLRKK